MRKSRLLSDSARLQPCSLLRRATLHSFSSAFFLHVLVTFPFFWPRAALPFFLREANGRKTGTDRVLCLR